MSDEPTVITLTTAAEEMVFEIRADEEDGDMLALFIEVNGVSGSDFAYDMYFAGLDEAGPGTAVESHGDLTVAIPAASVSQIEGATLDVEGTGADAQLVMLNPNKPKLGLGLGDGADTELTSDLAIRVIQVLNEQINPAIASHGGQAELVAVEVDTAYLRLGGGCQGCGMASVTLKQGIEVAIREMIPEIVQVVDITDHESGENPYYQASKK